MKAELKSKVITQLIKWGNNETDVLNMVELHFDSAMKNDEKSVKQIANFIRTIY
jgi:hypothetical protein